MYNLLTVRDAPEAELQAELAKAADWLLEGTHTPHLHRILKQ